MITEFAILLPAAVRPERDIERYLKTAYTSALAIAGLRELDRSPAAAGPASPRAVVLEELPVGLFAV